MKSKPRLVEQPEVLPDAVDYICIATNLLHQMFSELRLLAENNSELARAMSTHESVLHNRLWVLHETADLLVSANDHSIDVTLLRRATALISWISAEIDELALCAAGNESQLSAYQIVFH